MENYLPIDVRVIKDFRGLIEGTPYDFSDTLRVYYKTI